MNPQPAAQPSRNALEVVGIARYHEVSACERADDD
jgi:hypothetical protein